MKFVLLIDPTKFYDSMEKAKNFINNSNIISSFQHPKITVVFEEGGN